jgi:hypothetical protein
MEGYGGPNISATLSDETLSTLRPMGLDEGAIDELITALQRKIMGGAAHMQLHNDRDDSMKDKSLRPEKMQPIHHRIDANA